MKRWIAVILCFSCGFLYCGFCFAANTLEIDLIEKRLQFVDFHLGDKTLDADISFQFQRQDDTVRLDVEGRDVRFNNQQIGKVSVRLTKRGSVLFIEQLDLLQYVVKGTINLETQDVALNIEGHWQETSSEFLQGEIFVQAKAWGKFDNILTSGYLTVDNGKYEGQEFSKLRLDFLGKPPVLNITDSQIILYDGSTFEYVKAILDLRNLSSPIIPNPEFVSQKAYLGDWQVFGEDQGHAGLKKQIDKKFDVFLDTNKLAEQDRERLEGGTELRYNWKNNQFLKLRMEEDRTILGFEQRREF